MERAVVGLVMGTVIFCDKKILGRNLSASLSREVRWLNVVPLILD